MSGRKLYRDRRFLLSEFLEKYCGDFSFPRMERKALLHGHCHHKALAKMTAEEAVLRRVGVEFESPAPGCCGMAGAFGFERDKYDVSIAIGELELMPAVRRAPADWLIIADGFSCREQIAQGSERQSAASGGGSADGAAWGEEASKGEYPESGRERRRHEGWLRSMKRSGWGLAAAAAGMGMAVVTLPEER